MPETSFRFHRLRFSLRCHGGSVHFPPGKAANGIRGALGTLLRQLCCTADCPGARQCPRRPQCGYARIFEPNARKGPSGLRDQPRPFVLRASHLDGSTWRDGERFSFDLHLFLTAEPPAAQLVLAFAQLAEAGLGPTRGRVRLESVDTINGERIFEQGGAAKDLPPPEAVSLLESAALRRIEVDFTTPTELKHQGRIAARPGFGILVARALERLSALTMLHGETPVELDWQGFRERASTVRLVNWAARKPGNVSRFSTRTKHVHSLGGMMGLATYEGEAAGEFLGILRAAEVAGVGRQTVWGKGAIRVIR